MDCLKLIIGFRLAIKEFRAIALDAAVGFLQTARDPDKTSNHLFEILKHIDSSDLSQRGFMHLASESEPRLILKDRYHPYGIRQQSDAVQRWQVLRHACNDDWMLNINPNGCQLSRHRPSASAIDCAGFDTSGLARR